MKKGAKMKGLSMGRVARAAAVAVVAAVLATSCSNMVERVEPVQAAPVVDAAESGEQLAYLSLQAAAQGEGRTVLPSLTLKEDKGLVVSLIGRQGADGADSVIKSWRADGQKDALSLMTADTTVVAPALGDWTFRLAATRGEVTVMRSAADVTITVARGHNSLDFGALEYVSGTAGNTAPGLMELRLAWPEGSGVAAARGGLFTLDDPATAVEGFGLTAAVLSGSSATYSAEGVGAGEYLVKMLLYRDQAATDLMYTYMEVVRVKAGVMSRGERTLADVNKDALIRVTLDLLGGRWADGVERHAVKKGITVGELPVPARPEGASGTFDFWTDAAGKPLAATDTVDTEGTVYIAAWKDMTAADAAAAWPSGSSGRTYTLALTGPVTTPNTMDGFGTAIDSNNNALAILDLSKLEMTSFRSLGGENMVEVVLPDTLTSITGDSSSNPPFVVARKLRSITIPASLTSIPDGSFLGCTSLEKIVVAEGNPKYKVFEDGKIIQDKQDGTLLFYPAAKGDVVIPEGITGIKGSAFYDYRNITGVTISGSVKTIGDGAFKQCLGLTTVTIKEGVESIGSSAFYGCGAKLASVEIPGTVTSIGSSAFEGCTGLTSVGIPSGVTSISNSAFKGCTGLTSVEIPGTVTSIGSSAFYGCAKLASVEIPGTVTTIGGSAFYGCAGLTSVEIPSGVTSISNSAFYGCTGLTSVEIPGTVTSIGSSAFKGCTGLASVEIPNSVTSIGDGAFQNCTGLTGTLTIPNSVTSIGSGAFYNCAKLTGTLTIPNSVTSIGGSAFQNCTGLTGTLTIPNSVTSIDGFAGCTGLTSVEIPGTVTSIGSSAFYGCTGLTSVEIPSGVTSISNSAFKGCTGLTGTLTIPNTVTSIGEEAFSGCTGLTKLVTAAPIKDTTSSRNAFKNCTGLKTVILSGTYSYAVYGTGEDSLFCGCTNVETFSIKGASGENTYFWGYSYWPNLKTINYGQGSDLLLTYELPSTVTVNYNYSGPWQ